MNLIPLHDIIIIEEHGDSNNFSVSELSKGVVIKTGVDVPEYIQTGYIVYFYKGNNRKIDTKYSYLFSEDALFIEEGENNGR